MEIFMLAAVSLLKAFQANFPSLTQLLTMSAYLIGGVAEVLAVVMMQCCVRFDRQVPVTSIVIQAIR